MCLQTLDFFVSGRFLAKMQSRGIDLVNAQLLGYQEPGGPAGPDGGPGAGTAPLPAHPGPDGELSDITVGQTLDEPDRACGEGEGSSPAASQSPQIDLSI